MTYTEALAALEILYAELPQLACHRECQQSCGIIVMSRVEWLRLQRYAGYRPKGKNTLVCPLLKRGVCSAYPVRPLICRLWGISELMPCPWGCLPERWVGAAEGDAWLQRAEEISVGVFPGHHPAAAYAQRRP